MARPVHRKEDSCLLRPIKAQEPENSSAGVSARLPGFKNPTSMRKLPRCSQHEVAWLCHFKRKGHGIQVYSTCTLLDGALSRSSSQMGCTSRKEIAPTSQTQEAASAVCEEPLRHMRHERPLQQPPKAARPWSSASWAMATRRSARRGAPPASSARAHCTA